MADALAFLPTDQQPGDYRVLWIGDPRALPQPGWELSGGVAYALSNDGAPDIRDTWAGDATRSEDLVAEALGLATSGESARLGRMLGADERALHRGAAAGRAPGQRDAGVPAAVGRC